MHPINSVKGAITALQQRLCSLSSSAFDEPISARSEVQGFDRLTMDPASAESHSSDRVPDSALDIRPCA